MNFIKHKLILKIYNLVHYLKKSFSFCLKVSNDHDVAKITEMGFKAEEANNALRISNGNVQQALDYLLKGGGSMDRRSQGGPNRQSNYESGDRRGQGGPNRQSSYEDRKPQGVMNRQTNNDSDRGRGRRDRRDDDTGI
jgi:hypothetical protein